MDSSHLVHISESELETPKQEMPEPHFPQANISPSALGYAYASLRYSTPTLSHADFGGIVIARRYNGEFRKREWCGMNATLVIGPSVRGSPMLHADESSVHMD